MRLRLSLFVLALLIPVPGAGQGNHAFTGKWTFIRQMGDDIGLYASLSIEFRQMASTIIIIQKWGTGRSFVDSISLEVGGKINRVPISNRVWPTNVFMGLSMPIGRTKQIKAMWEKNGKMLKLDESYSIRGSQGMSPMSAVHTYELSNDGELLTYIVSRSTRTTGPPVKYVLRKPLQQGVHHLAGR